MKVDVSFLHYKKKKLDSAFQPKDILGKFIFFYFFLTIECLKNLHIILGQKPW